MSENTYDDPNLCVKCGKLHTIVKQVHIESHMAEAETECHNCGHKDYWAYGWFQSLGDPEEDKL